MYTCICLFYHMHSYLEAFTLSCNISVYLVLFILLTILIYLSIYTFIWPLFLPVFGHTVSFIVLVIPYFIQISVLLRFTIVYKFRAIACLHKQHIDTIHHKSHHSCHRFFVLYHHEVIGHVNVQKSSMKLNILPICCLK